MIEKPDDELTEDSHGRPALQVEREASQGVELFEDPDAQLPASSLMEGSPGHEMLSGDGAGLEADDDEERPSEG